MELEEIKEYILENYEGMTVNESYGETTFYYSPEGNLTGGTYFMTINETDKPNDSASKLNRDRIFRVSVGSGRETFLKLFGVVPKRPPKGSIIEGAYEFERLDEIMPHPIYGWANWVCVLNPSNSTFDMLVPIIREYYQLSRARYEKKIRKHTEE